VKIKVMASGPLRLKIDFPLAKVKQGGEFTEIMGGCDGKAFQRNRALQPMVYSMTAKVRIDGGIVCVLQPMVCSMTAKVRIDGGIVCAVKLKV
jgi:hypothetical protein